MASREPFSRHARGGEPADEWELTRVADYAASTYGWGPPDLDEYLTDEQLVAYFDAAQERQSEHVSAEFERMVEAVRVGYIFARDQKQYDRWARKRKHTKPLSGAALEQVVMGLARAHPEYIAYGGA